MEDAMKKGKDKSRAKILFLCNFSNPLIRERVILKRDPVRTMFYKLKHKKPHYEADYAVWVSDYIEQFEQHPEFEFHIVAPMQGLKGESQQFEENGIYYHFYNCSYSLFKSLTNVAFNYEERHDYPTIRKRISKIRNKINPNLVILCGAENPYYSIGVLDEEQKPVYVILQTLLNSPKRIEMGVGTPYKRKIELEIFKHSGFFCTSDEKEIAVIKGQNNNAVILPAGFPTHRPTILMPDHKEFDFAFFAKTVGKHKGIEDVLKALAIVKQSKPGVRLIVIGGTSNSYLEHLKEMIDSLSLQGNVFIAGLFQELKDTFLNVAKAKAAVLPGITGILNSTVREAMLMGLPIICYEIRDTKEINREKECVLTAPMEDVEALASRMLYVLDNPRKSEEVALNGKAYAERNYSNKAIVNRLMDNCREILKDR